MIYVTPRKEEQQTSLRNKTFSYSEVEDLLYELVMYIDNLEIMQENNIMLTPIIQTKDRGLDVLVKQDNKVCKLFFNMEDR